MYTIDFGSNPVLAHPLQLPLLPDLVPVLEFLLPSSWPEGGGGWVSFPPLSGLKTSFEHWDNLL